MNIIKLITPRFVTSTHIIHNLRQYYKTEPKNVIEIGAGVGYIAYVFRILYPKIKYAIVDLPMTSVLQSSIYATMFGDENMWFSNEQSNDEALLKIYQPSDINLIENNSVDFYINHNSFPEIPQHIQQKYLSLMKQSLKSDGFFYSVNWEPEGIDQTPTHLACKVANMTRIARSLFNGEDIYLSKVPLYQQEIYKYE